MNLCFPAQVENRVSGSNAVILGKRRLPGRSNGTVNHKLIDGRMSLDHAKFVLLEDQCLVNPWRDHYQIRRAFVMVVLQPLFICYIASETVIWVTSSPRFLITRTWQWIPILVCKPRDSVESQAANIVFPWDKTGGLENQRRKRAWKRVYETTRQWKQAALVNKVQGSIW